jgi:uncharacterized protein YgbK (DUF1537 family)
MHNETISHVYVEGGATAALLFRHVGITRLKVVREVAPGVVTLSTSDGQGPIFTLKPGSYVWPDEIQAKLGV